MAYAILIKASAEKEIRRLPQTVRKRVLSAVLALQENPRPSGVCKLKRQDGDGWRIRVGDYRVIYQIDDDLCQVMIYRVRHRREVYRF